MTFMKC